jgi:hypothetical protein
MAGEWNLGRTVDGMGALGLSMHASYVFFEVRFLRSNA